MKLYIILQYISYLLVFIGSYYGINEISKNNIENGINKFVQIGIMPLLFISFLRHTVFSGTIIKSHPFFEIEAGGANLGIFISLLVGYLLKIPIQSIACILLVFFVYLIVAMIAHIRYLKKSSLLQTIPMNGILLYFILKGFKII